MYGTVSSSSSQQREELTPPPSSPSPFRYHVQEGDTLASVAHQTQTTEAALLALNPLLGRKKRHVKLYPGQQLIVEEARAVSLPPPPECIDSGWGQMHLVRAGETMRGIAALYNTTEEILRQDNRRYFPTGERSMLCPGQLLHVRLMNTGEMEEDEPADVDAAASQLNAQGEHEATYTGTSATRRTWSLLRTPSRPSARPTASPTRTSCRSTAAAIPWGSAPSLCRVSASSCRTCWQRSRRLVDATSQRSSSPSRSTSWSPVTRLRNWPGATA